MRMLISTALIVLALISAGPTSAQSPAPSAETLAAAREVVAATKATDQVKIMLPMIMQAIKPAIVQGRAAIDKEYDKLVPHMIEVASTLTADFEQAFIMIYARHFSTAELRDLVTFFRGPTGQKMLQKQPAILQESLIVGQKFGEKIAPELQKRTIEELRKRGHNI
jgi:uncharacterized protein